MARNGSYERPLYIWFGYTPTAQVKMPIEMRLNVYMQWWKREANHNLRRTCALTYLRYVARCRIWYRKNSSLSLRRFLMVQNQQNTTNGLLFSWTHGMSWSLMISIFFIKVKMWTPKQFSIRWCVRSIIIIWLHKLLSIQAPHRY